MLDNKWFYFICAFIGGTSMSGQAIHYFIGGESVGSSWIRHALVVAQFVVGVVIAFWGWKKFRELSETPKSS